MWLPLPEHGPALDHHVAFQHAAVAQGHVVFDHRKRPDLNPRTKPGLRTDQGRRVNFHGDASGWGGLARSGRRAGGRSLPPPVNFYRFFGGLTWSPCAGRDGLTIFTSRHPSR